MRPDMEHRRMFPINSFKERMVCSETCLINDKQQANDRQQMWVHFTVIWYIIQNALTVSW